MLKKHTKKRIEEREKREREKESDSLHECSITIAPDVPTNHDGYSLARFCCSIFNYGPRSRSKHIKKKWTKNRLITFDRIIYFIMMENCAMLCNRKTFCFSQIWIFFSFCGRVSSSEANNKELIKRDRAWMEAENMESMPDDETAHGRW